MYNIGRRESPSERIKKVTETKAPQNGILRTLGMILVLLSSLCVILVTLAMYKNPDALWALFPLAIMIAKLSDTPRRALNQGLAVLVCNIAVLAVVLIIGDPVFILLLIVSAIIMVRV